MTKEDKTPHAREWQIGFYTFKIPLNPPDMADNCQGEKTSPTAFTYKSAFYSYMQGINRDVIIVATVDHSDIRVF